MAWSINKKNRSMDIRQEALISGDEKRIEKEHKKGKLTARERMNLFFDNQTYTELEMLSKSHVELGEVKKQHYSGDGVITGYGEVNGTIVFAVAQDCKISGGAGGETHVNKICRALELAIKMKAPIVFLCDSGGARIEEGIVSLSAYSRLFYLNTQASGYIPQIAAIMGNCAGGSSYSPAMCDFVFMVENTGQFFITGPKVIKALTGEDITMNELGGTEIHGKYSGQAHYICKNDTDCIEQIKCLLKYLTIKQIEQMKTKVDYVKLGESIEDIIPENPRKSYDVRDVIEKLVDNKEFFEINQKFAMNIVVGFSRLDGKTIGIVANQPQTLGGSIDCDAADKCSRFIRTCDCFDIPLLVMVDVPGFYPGEREEKKGILRHGSKVLFSFAEATVPKISLVMRKAYGGAYCAMNSKNLGADIVFAWPICELAVMGADGAVDVLFNRELKAEENSDSLREKKIAEYEEKYLNPFFAAAYGMIDDVILPCETRNRLIVAFKGLESKSSEKINKKHDNIPL